MSLEDVVLPTDTTSATDFVEEDDDEEEGEDEEHGCSQDCDSLAINLNSREDEEDEATTRSNVDLHRASSSSFLSGTEDDNDHNIQEEAKHDKEILENGDKSNSRTTNGIESREMRKETNEEEEGHLNRSDNVEQEEDKRMRSPRRQDSREEDIEKYLNRRDTAVIFPVSVTEEPNVPLKEGLMSNNKRNQRKHNNSRCRDSKKVLPALSEYSLSFILLLFSLHSRLLNESLV
jgi:hypothetical protein